MNHKTTFKVGPSVGYCRNSAISGTHPLTRGFDVSSGSSTSVSRWDWTFIEAWSAIAESVIQRKLPGRPCQNRYRNYDIIIRVSGWNGTIYDDSATSSHSKNNTRTSAYVSPRGTVLREIGEPVRTGLRMVRLISKISAMLIGSCTTDWRCP